MKVQNLEYTDPMKLCRYCTGNLKVDTLVLKVGVFFRSVSIGEIKIETFEEKSYRFVKIIS